MHSVIRSTVQAVSIWTWLLLTSGKHADFGEAKGFAFHGVSVNNDVLERLTGRCAHDVDVLASFHRATELTTDRVLALVDWRDFWRVVVRQPDQEVVQATFYTVKVETTQNVTLQMGSIGLPKKSAPNV